jgi:hypothetical protein
VTSTPPPREPTPGPRITPSRVTTWVVVGGIGAFLLVSGIMGMIAKG